MHGGGGIEFNSLIVISYAAPSHAAISCTTCLIVNWLKIKKKIGFLFNKPFNITIFEQNNKALQLVSTCMSRTTTQQYKACVTCLFVSGCETCGFKNNIRRLHMSP